MSNTQTKEYLYKELSELKIDNIAKENPMMNKAAFKLLVEDIRANGQQEPVLIHDGKIIDGRNRFNACKELARKLKAIVFNGTREDAIKKARSNNDMRRHLSKSQYAMMAAKVIMDSRVDGDKKVSKDKWIKVEETKEVKEGRTSKRLVEDAIRVIKDKSIKNKINAVIDGIITISEAIVEINKKKQEVKDKKDGKDGKNSKLPKTFDDYRTELKAISSDAVEDYNKMVKDRTQTKAALVSEVVKLRIELANLKDNSSKPQ